MTYDSNRMTPIFIFVLKVATRPGPASTVASRAASSRRVRSGMVGIALTTSASHAAAHQAAATASAASAAAAAAAEITVGSQVRIVGKSRGNYSGSRVCQVPTFLGEETLCTLIVLRLLR